MHTHAQPVLFILMGLLTWIRWKELGLEYAIPLAGFELYFHAIRWLSAGPVFSSRSHLLLQHRQLCFPTRPGHHPGYPWSYGALKNNLNSMFWKSVFQDQVFLDSHLSPYSVVIRPIDTGIWGKAMGLRPWFPGSMSNQPGGEGECLGKYHGPHLRVSIGTYSHASKEVWGERLPPLPACSPQHQEVTAARPLQIVGDQPRKSIASLGMFVVGPAK